MAQSSSVTPRLKLGSVLASLRGTIWQIALLSGVINLLALTGSFFMLQVYDRALPSRSLPTLGALALVAALLFIFQGFLELIRGRVLVQIGLALDQRMSRRVYHVIMQLPLRAKRPGDGLQPVRDLDQVRSFLSGSGPTALFDLPWMPLYIGLCFLFHVWIGVAALGGALVLVTLTIIAEVKARATSRTLAELASQRIAMADASRRNAEAAHAMGFSGHISERWQVINREFLAVSVAASNTSGMLNAISRTSRMALQSGMLAIGAILVIAGEASGGIMIASSIMLSRALAPVELATANWRNFIAARQGWGRLTELLALLPEDTNRLSLPAPSAAVSVEGVAIVPPGSQKFVVLDASFRLERGAGLGIIGPSASGKSSLAKALVGIWTPAKGTVRLDGAALLQWAPAELGKYIGYLPQEVSLFEGTIAQNIARFTPNTAAELIVSAARAAGVHDLIVQLPDGYDTAIGETGSVLSTGQRQRIALARALFGDPFLVVLDEPNSNLDVEGEAALVRAIAGVRERNGIVVVVAHRPSALAGIDLILVMNGGRVQTFGPKDQIFRPTVRPSASSAGLVVVGSAEMGGHHGS